MQDRNKGMDFYSDIEVKSMGFLFIGEDVRIHRSVCFYHIDKISIGNHVNISPFCVIKGCVELEDHVIVGEYSSFLAETGKICVKKNATIYQRVVIDSGRRGDNLFIVIDENTQIETQCIITKSRSNLREKVIPMLTII